MADDRPDNMTMTRRDALAGIISATGAMALRPQASYAQLPQATGFPRKADFRCCRA